MDKNYFNTRHTIRKYSNQQVSDALINEIISDAMHAPTTGNMQLYSVVATRSNEMKERLSPTHFNQPSVKDASVVLTVCADFYRFERWCKVSNANPGYENFLSFITATIDAIIFAQQIVTIAEMKGLGTCYLGTVVYNAAEIASILDLPDRVIPVACITMGYPDGKGDESERLPIEAILHHEQYHHYTDNEIRELYKTKDEYPANEQYIKENNKETLAQVFTDVRYPRTVNEPFSDKLLEFIRSRKFI
jgi:nitroreductase